MAPVYEGAIARTDVPGAGQQMSGADFGDKVKHGFYLATIAHCMECHTPEAGGHNDFSLLGKGGREFKGPWGVSISRNLTASKTAGLGSWSDAEIKRAITQGLDKDGNRLKPPMGFGYYAKMTERTSTTWSPGCGRCRRRNEGRLETWCRRAGGQPPAFAVADGARNYQYSSHTA